MILVLWYKIWQTFYSYIYWYCYSTVLGKLLHRRSHTKSILSFVYTNMLKKVAVWAVVGLVAFASIGSAQFLRWVNQLTDPTADTWETENLELIGAGTWQGDSLANVIRWFVNWTLGILALIALLILLYGWFQMVTAAWDEDKYGQWFTILKQAAAWLAMIWVAWFIVSMIFFVINLVGRWGENTPGSTAG